MFLRNQFWEIVSALELTKERFLICKKRAKVFPSVFEKRKRVLENMEAKKSLSLPRVFIGDIR